MANYSVDIVKKYAFQDELFNVISVLNYEEINNDIIIVKCYLEKRIEQLNNLSSAD